MEKIIYPTGGYTVYDYEGNTTSDIDALPVGYQNELITESRQLNVVEGQGESEMLFSIENAPYSANVSGGGEDKTFLKWNITGLDCEMNTIDCGIIKIRGISDPTYIASISSHTGTVLIPNGDYKMTGVYCQDGNDSEIVDFSITFSWTEKDITNSLNQMNVGGLRVKTTKTYESVSSSPIVKNYEYTTEKDESLTSGRLPSIMGYVDTQAPASSCNYGLKLLMIKSSSHYPTVQTQGGYVCYERVTVKNGENKDQGKTVNTYSFTKDLFEEKFPFVTLKSHKHKRGDLLKTEVYSHTGNLLSKTSNEYEYVFTGDVENVQLSDYGKLPDINIASGSLGVGYPAMTLKFKALLPTRYKYYSYWKRLKSTTQTTYDKNNPQLFKEQTTNYFYNEDALHTLPIRTETIVDGKKLITHTKYPLDYREVISFSNPQSQSIVYLQNKNIVASPIETYTTQQTNGEAEKVVSAQLMVYESDKPYLKEIHQLEANSTISEGLIENFTPSALDAQGNFTMDNRYEKRLEYYAYDQYGNPLEFSKTKDVHKSYLWGYDNTYPVAEVINASQEEIVYTSFEEENGNTIQSARTGIKSFRLQSRYPLKENLPRGKYLFSVWVKGAGTLTVLDKSKIFNSPNEWLRIEFKLEVNGFTNIDITGNDFLIDEARLHPVEAHMITRTYTPLIGVTSETNVNHNSTFYEYDALGRLHIIRDQEGNIIKRIDYQYKED